jgi:hypothetical protein
VVSESNVRGRITELADTTVGCQVPRMQSRIRVRMHWALSALRNIHCSTVVRTHRKDTRCCRF